jgi:hypothetical protein
MTIFHLYLPTAINAMREMQEQGAAWLADTLHAAFFVAYTLAFFP